MVTPGDAGDQVSVATVVDVVTNPSITGLFWSPLGYQFAFPMLLTLILFSCIMKSSVGLLYLLGPGSLARVSWVGRQLDQRLREGRGDLPLPLAINRIGSARVLDRRGDPRPGTSDTRAGALSPARVILWGVL